MKGGIELTSTHFVVIVVLLLVLAGAIIIMGYITPIIEQQAYRGTLEACCIQYTSHCGSGVFSISLPCDVSETIDPDGNMPMNELAEKAGVETIDIVKICCKEFE